MAFKFSHTVDVRSSCASEESIIHQVESLLTALGGLGLEIQEAEPGSDEARIRIYEPYLGCSESSLVCMIPTPLTTDSIATLVNLYNRTVFECGFYGLSLRMSNLGWTAYIDGNHSAHIQTSPQSSMMYGRLDQDALHNLQNEVLRAELRQELSDHHKDFVEAGIIVEVGASDFSFVLQENDPEIKRSLTKANVDKLIALTQAWNERF